MRELHLFAGIGGGILGGLLLGHRCVGAVEIDPYCRRVLEERQRDGCLPAFPIHDDIRTFDGTAWRGRVDVVCGGFPCQDISDAGKRVGLDGARSSLWLEMLRVVREVGPRYVFVENVAALLVRGFDRVLGGLADLGFDAEWTVLSAAECGAPHLRKRLWLLGADAGGEQHEGGASADERTAAAELPADASGVRIKESWPLSAPSEPERDRKDVPDADRARLEVRCLERGDAESQLATTVGGRAVAYANRLRQLQPQGLVADEWRRTRDRGWWESEPDVGRVAHGVPARVDRLRGLGNAQSPIQAATAFAELMGRLEQ